ncbi:MAG: hypothetical protein H0T42_34755 [Deltaproteobacteria bacterium]|nr:hypothetical protein [Deltaproteobacteria bacterium]
MRAVIGSVAVHAVIAWLAFHGDREGAATARATSPVAVTMIEPVEVALLPSTEDGAPARTAPTRSRTIDTDPRGSITVEHSDPRGDLPTGERDTSGELGDAGLRFDGRGMGLGRGGTGTGTGIGFGEGGKVAPGELLTPPPAPPGDPPSRARPAQLIYPTRQRDVEDAELFIARVIVDDDGFVAGAKLVRGFGGRRDEVASQMIWRFRYAPALDADGRPIRSTLDQRFLVAP